MTRCWVSEKSSGSPVSQVSQAKAWKRLQGRHTLRDGRQDAESREARKGRLVSSTVGKGRLHGKWAQHSILLLILSLILTTTP